MAISVRPGSRWRILRRERLVLPPSETADPFIVTLGTGTYAIRWYSVRSRETVEADMMTVDSSTTINFSAPVELERFAVSLAVPQYLPGGMADVS
jgi:hypothetical protein